MSIVLTKHMLTHTERKQMIKAIKFRRIVVGQECKVLGQIRSSRARARAAAISVLAASLIVPSASRANDGDECRTFTVDVTQHLKSNAQNDVDPAEGQTLF